VDSRAGTWVAVIALLCAGVAYSSWQTKQRAVEAEATLRAMFHVPDDAEVEVFGQYGKFGAVQIGIVADLTVDQYAEYRSHMDDAVLWSFKPFEARGVDLTGPVSPDALQWVRGDAGAFNRCFWVDWGPLLDSGVQQLDPNAMRSMCYVAVDVGEGNIEIRACRDAGELQRHLFARAALDTDGRRLYAMIKI
jgi:hypothetical protein